MPTTQQYVNIAEIRDSIIITKTGLLRRVIVIEPVNFALKSEEDQNIIIGQYQNFLNSLNFPVQILVQSRRLDVMPYLDSLTEKVANIGNELLRFHANEYIQFIQGLTELSNIMDKKFYLIVGYDPPTVTSKGLFGNILGKKEQSKITFSISDWKKYTEELEQRVNLINSGLGAMGLGGHLLDTQATIELFYNVYNPQEGISEKLTDTNELRTPVITAKNNNLAEEISAIKPPELNSQNQTPNTDQKLPETGHSEKSSPSPTTPPTPQPIAPPATPNNNPNGTNQ